MDTTKKDSPKVDQSLLESPRKGYGTDFSINEDDNDNSPIINENGVEANCKIQSVLSNRYIICKIVCLSLSVVVLVSLLLYR